MPNTLTFTTPMAPLPITAARISRAADVNWGQAMIAVGVELTKSDGDAVEYLVTVTNDTSDKIEADTSQVRGFRLVTEFASPNAFTLVMGAFVTAAAQGQVPENAMLTVMASLGILPSGTVS